MLDPGLHEAVTFGLEPMALVETERRHLRIQPDFGPAAFAGLRDQCQQQRIADPATAPRRAHRHPPDVLVRGQTRGADGGAVQQPRDHVRACRIQRIVLDLDRDALLADEDLVAHCAQFGQRRLEIDDADMERLQAWIIGVHCASSASCKR